MASDEVEWFIVIFELSHQVALLLKDWAYFKEDENLIIIWFIVQAVM